MEHVLTHHDRKADENPATASSVPRPSEKKALHYSITTPHDRQAEEKAPAPRVPVPRPFKRRPLDRSTTRPGNNRHLRGLPQDWCDWCLASHPYPDEERSYHLRPSSENKAMHDAIASGAMPKVDPWAANMAAVQAAKAIIKASKVPKPPKPARDTASMYTVDVPDEVMDIIKSRDSVEDKMAAYFARQKIEDDKVKIEDDKIRACEAAEFARVVATANLPTGPPSKKRRRENVARESRQQQSNNDTRPGKHPRVANPALATSESSNLRPTFQQPRYQSMAAQSAPVSNNKTQGVQQPLQQPAISSDASSKKDAEPTDAPPARKAGCPATPA